MSYLVGFFLGVQRTAGAAERKPRRRGRCWVTPQTVESGWRDVPLHRSLPKKSRYVSTHLRYEKTGGPEHHRDATWAALIPNRPRLHGLGAAAPSEFNEHQDWGMRIGLAHLKKKWTRHRGEEPNVQQSEKDRREKNAMSAFYTCESLKCVKRFNLVGVPKITKKQEAEHTWGAKSEMHIQKKAAPGGKGKHVNPV